MNCPRTNLLLENIPIRPCRQVWKLVKKIISTINKYIPRNYKKFMIWDEKIMGKEPLNLLMGHEDIQNWMKSRGFTTLYSISSWENRNWQEWYIPSIPQNLKGQWDSLPHHLKGVAPTSMEEEDTFVWDPSGGSYTVKIGYTTLQEEQNQQDWAPWKFIWKTESLPKIKIFIWTLLKGKILTSENLKRKGFSGPSKCQTCLMEEETIQHIFLDCTIIK